MEFGKRLRELRKIKKLTQGDIEKRTGLLRCYTSAVENGRVTPSFKTVEKYARALEIPLYQIFYDGDPDEIPVVLTATVGFERTEEGRAEMKAFAAAWTKMKLRDRRLLVATGELLAGFPLK